jgi:uncharacterized protein (DUF1778 family)
MKRDGRFAYMVYCTKEQRQIIRNAAKRERRRMSQYVLNVVLGQIGADQKMLQQKNRRDKPAARL